MQRRAAWLLAGAVLAATPRAAPAAWDPPGWRRAPPEAAEEPASPAALPFAWALAFYRRVVSPVDGDRCPSSPTCSAYAGEALAAHGPVLGFALTAGRLLGEADEAAFAPRVFAGGRWRVYSPVADDLAFLRGRLAP